MIRKGQRCIWLFLLCIIGISEVSALESSRFALVIGNGDYQHMTSLANPVNDAIDIAGVLEKFDFQVTLETNTATAGMDQVIRQFVDFVSNKPTEIALFYYAGHGVQYNGVNYLLPVNVDIQNNYELMDKAISMDRITNGLDQSGSPFNLIMLDACRDNPFLATRGSSRGLSTMGDGGQGSMVVFATAPGSVAQDGEGSNSPFAGALLEHMIGTPDLEIHQLITEVQRSVQEATNGKQIPWVNTSFTGEFYFQTVEDQLVRNQNERDALQEELSELEREIAERKSAISSSPNSEDRRRLEAEQQKAKAQETAKLLESQRLAELQRQAEEVLASRETQDALRQEMEQRLSSQQELLVKQAEQRRVELEKMKLQSGAVANLSDRLNTISQFYSAITDIEIRYAQILNSTQLELNNLYDKRVAAYKAENPRDPWETPKDHAERLQDRLVKLEEDYLEEREQYKQDIVQQLSSETTPLKEKVVQAKAELNGMRFTPGSEETEVVVETFDPNEKRFPIIVQVADTSVFYNIPLYYAITSRDREVLRDEYYRVFSADQSKALIGRVIYAVYELETDLWGVFLVSVEVVNLLEDDAVLVSQGIGETVHVGDPLVLFRTSNTVERVSVDSGISNNLLVTGLPPETTVAMPGQQTKMFSNGLLFDSVKIPQVFKVTASGRWMAEDATLSSTGLADTKKLVWIDFSEIASITGELFIPRTDVVTKIQEESGELVLDVSVLNSKMTNGGVLLTLHPGTYQISFKLPEDPYFTDIRSVTINGAERITLDPGDIRLSTLFKYETAMAEKELLDEQIRKVSIEKGTAWGVLGTGIVGIAGSIVSYLLYTDAVNSYDNAILTADATAFRKDTQLWSTLFSVSAGIGLAGTASGGVMLALAPDTKSLSDQMNELEKKIQKLNSEIAADKAGKAMDEFTGELGK